MMAAGSFRFCPRPPTRITLSSSSAPRLAWISATPYRCMVAHSNAASNGKVSVAPSRKASTPEVCTSSRYAPNEQATSPCTDNSGKLLQKRSIKDKNWERNMQQDDLDATYAADLLRRQDALQAEAQQVIAELNLSFLLSQVGKTEQIGSSMAGLMV